MRAAIGNREQPVICRHKQHLPSVLAHQLAAFALELAGLHACRLPHRFAPQIAVPRFVARAVFELDRLATRKLPTAPISATGTDAANSQTAEDCAACCVMPSVIPRKLATTPARHAPVALPTCLTLLMPADASSRSRSSA